MKRLLAVLIIGVFGVVSASAIGGVADTTIVTSITDPGYLTTQIKQLQSYIDEAEHWITELQYINTTVQYQAKAVEALQNGGWDGFVTAFQDETDAISSFSSAASDLPTLVGNDVDESTLKDLQSFADATSKLNQRMQAADKLVDSTNSLVQQSKSNTKLISTGLDNAKSAGGALAATQANAQILAGIGNELSAMSSTLYATQSYITTMAKIEEQQAKVDKKNFDDFMNVPTASDSTNPFYADPSTTSVFDKALDGSWYTDDQ
jgi:conjugal transfer/entry exclusion protein